MDSSDNRPLYQGQSIKQDTSEVFRTEEPETCILVVNSAHGTLLCLIEATDADRVAGEQWTTDEHLEDIFTRRADGSIESLGSFIENRDDHSRGTHGDDHHPPTPNDLLIDLQAAAENSTDDVRLLYDRKGAARQLSISVRTLDYFIANKKLATRRMGKKVLIPRAELVRFSRADHFGPVNAAPDTMN